MQEQVIPFNHDLISELSEYRSDFFTEVFRFFSELGNTEGYLVIIALLFTVINKRLGVYATIVALFTIVINHLIKVSLKNPRPFVVSNQYLEEWGVSSHRAVELINEYSTPSGHAMTSAAFFGFLFLRIRQPVVRVLILITILGIGFARPYLGVHFFEDILLGWLLGFTIAYIAHKTIEPIWEKWLTLSFVKQLLCVAFLVISSWLLNNIIDPRSVAEYPQSFVSILGFLSGTLIAASFEERRIAFSYVDSSLPKSIGRFILMITVLLFSLSGLDYLFAQIAEDATLLGLVSTNPLLVIYRV